MLYEQVSPVLGDKTNGNFVVFRHQTLKGLDVSPRRILAKHAQDSWLAPNCKRKKIEQLLHKTCCCGGEVFDCMKVLSDPQRGTHCMPAYAGVSGLVQRSEEFAGKQKVWSLSYDRLWRKWLGVTD